MTRKFKHSTIKINQSMTMMKFRLSWQPKSNIMLVKFISSVINKNTQFHINILWQIVLSNSPVKQSHIQLKLHSYWSTHLIPPISLHVPLFCMWSYNTQGHTHNKNAQNNNYVWGSLWDEPRIFCKHNGWDMLKADPFCLICKTTQLSY